MGSSTANKYIFKDGLGNQTSCYLQVISLKSLTFQKVIDTYLNGEQFGSRSGLMLGLPALSVILAQMPFIVNQICSICRLFSHKKTKLFKKLSIKIGMVKSLDPDQALRWIWRELDANGLHR